MGAYSRRQFIAMGSGAAAGVGLGFIAAPGVRASAVPTRLRPPGASSEEEFLAACIRCGQCAQACPSDVLHLADLSAGLSAGTPYFVAAETPCNLCSGHESMKCIDACPTSALSPIPIESVDIGDAVLSEEACLAYNGVVCRTCWHVCPFPDKALYFDELLRVRVDTDRCVGCGLCELACPTDPKSIVVTRSD